MREILFRGKRTDNGIWIYGSLFKRIFTHYIFPLPSKTSMTEVQGDTIGQFTGLNDKNGKKIFEGDVFKFQDEIFESYHTSCGTEYNSWETENYGVVGYNEDYGRYEFVQYKYDNNTVEADLHENKYLEFADFVNELEIIGNIHDNPGLIKEAQDVQRNEN